MKVAGDDQDVARAGDVRVHDSREPGIANRVPCCPAGRDARTVNSDARCPSVQACTCSTPAHAPDRAAPEHCAQVGDLRALTGDLAGSVAAYLEALREAGGLWGERDGERVAGKLAGALGGSAAHVTGL